MLMTQMRTTVLIVSRDTKPKKPNAPERALQVVIDSMAMNPDNDNTSCANLRMTSALLNTLVLRLSPPLFAFSRCVSSGFDGASIFSGEAKGEISSDGRTLKDPEYRGQKATNDKVCFPLYCPIKASLEVKRCTGSQLICPAPFCEPVLWVGTPFQAKKKNKKKKITTTLCRGFSFALQAP